MKRKPDLKLTFAIFDVFTELVCITDAAGTMIYANPSLKALYPSSVKEHPEFPWKDFSGEFSDAGNKIYSHILSASFRVTRRDISHLNLPGATYLWTALPEPDYINENHLPQGQLAGEWYKTLFENSPSGITLLDEFGIIIAVNEAVCISSQYTRDELINQHISLMALPGNHPIIEQNIQKILNGFTLNHEVKSRRKDGSFFYVFLSESVITLPNGRKGILSISNDISGYKEMVMALKKSEKEFRTIANYTANWEMWLDREGRVKWTNPAAYKFSGYTPEQFERDPELIFNILATPFRTNVKSAFKKALKGSKSKGMVFKYLNQEKERWLSVTWTPMRDSDGVIQGLRTSGQDITDLILAQHARNTSDNLNQKLIDNAPFGMHFYTLNEEDELIFTNFNPAAEQILKIDHKVLIGQKLEDAFPFLRDTEMIERYREAAILNKAWYSEQVINNGDILGRTYELRAFQTEPGQMVVLFNDITPRKITEAALVESRQLFEVLTRMAPVGIFRTNRWGATTFVNPEWCALTGLSYEQGLKGKYMQTIHPEDRQKCTDEWVETVKNGSSIISEYRFIRPNGNVIWVQGQAVPEIVNNEVKGFIGTITDITEIIDSKNELLKAKEKAEASNLLKTMFMQNISHEIRTPLNGIFGFAQLLSTGEYTEEEKLEFMRFLEESISRLTKTIDNIMEISLLMSGNMQKNNAIFNLHEWINEIYQEHHQKVANKNLLFTLKDSVDKNESLIMADKALLKRVIEEIIDNAVKFTLQGSITLSCALPEDELIIEISDTGQGIDKVFMPMLFEPFIQQSSVLPGIKSSGGIGLSIVKGIVDLLGGKIHVSSDAQNGTSIVVKVPIERLVQRAKKTKESSNSPTKENPRILVVEDEEINLLFIKKLLSKYPCQLMISGNGLHAIELLKKHPDLDLVLMDIKLPGISGIETIRKMIEIKPDLKIAAVTAYSSLEDRNACVAAGCVDFITKPFYSEELFDLTGRLINWPFGYTADEPPA